MIFETHSGSFSVSTDRERIDVPLVHGFLTQSYWARGISVDTVRRAIEHSLCFGLYEWERQIGFARVISDFTTFAYLADVFVVEHCRGLGLGLFLVQSVLRHPDLGGLRRFSLVTRDAHGLYKQVGFQTVSDPNRHMEILRAERPALP